MWGGERGAVAAVSECHVLCVCVCVCVCPCPYQIVQLREFKKTNIFMNSLNTS